MKNSIITFVTVLLLSSCASNTSFNSFYSENKKECELSISSPAFIANLFIPKEEVKEYEDLFKRVKHYKIMIFSDAPTSLDKKFNRFIKQKKYTSIFRVNKKGENVQLYFLKQKNTIKEIILKVKDENEYVILGLKTNILESDFNNIIEKSNVTVTSN